MRNPFRPDELAYAVRLSGQGIATSGTYRQGEHIYDPRTGQPRADVVSCTVIGPDVYEADRFATAAFAMGTAGLNFIEKLEGFEGYEINRNGLATMTSNFEAYVKKDV